MCVLRQSSRHLTQRGNGGSPRRHSILVAVLAAATLIPTASCTTPEFPPAGGSGVIGSPVWLPSGWIYYGKYRTDQETQIYRARPDALSKPERVDVTLPECKVLDQPILVALQGGTLGLATSCGEPGTRLFAYQEKAASAREIARLPIQAIDIAWRADPLIGYSETAVGATFCSSITRFRKTGVEALEEPITVNHEQWRLDAGYLGDTNCAARGDARAPVMDDAGHVYLVVSALHASERSTREDRARSRAMIYRIRHASDTAEKLSDGFSDVQGIAIAPQAELLVVDGVHDGQPGLWSMHTTRVATPVRIYDGDAAAPEFSPDGRKVVFVAYSNRARHLDSSLQIREVPAS